MEIEDELFFEDDIDILDVIDIGFPRRINERTDFFNSLDDMSFFRRFRLTKPTVFNLLEQIEEQLEFENNLNNSVSPINQLLTTLRFYACDGHQISIGDFVGVHQSTVSRIIAKVSRIIANLGPHYLKFPSAHNIVHAQQRFFEIARFPRVVGCVDGTHIKIQSPGGEDAEVYRNRKSFFSINTQVCCDANLKLLDVVARWPGSAHDVTIFNSSRLRARFEGEEFPNSILLGDSGYTLRPYFLTPLLNPVARGEQLYNEALIRTRNCVERSIGVWKRRFPVLAYGLRCKVETVLPIIISTAVLHNMAIEMNEDLPPAPENIGPEGLNYLIEQGQIPQLQPNAAERIINYRQELINNYFSNL